MPLRRPQPAAESPLRAELYSADQMERHGKALAAGHRLRPGRPARRRAEPLLARLTQNESVLVATGELLKATVTRGQRIAPAGEWLLDNAISDAVSSFGRHRDEAISARGERDQREWRGTLGDEQRRLLYTAAKAFAALKLGNIGLRGATGALLERSLQRLRELIDESLPTEMNTPPRP